MLLLGHTGIALGAAVILTGTLASSRFSKATRNVAMESPPLSSRAIPEDKAPWLDSLARRLDIRLLLIGSLLPDIIDKLFGHFFFRETFSNGRIFSHTLLFLILATAAGFYFYRRRSQTWLLSLSSGILAHLMLDQIWRVPQTLFWPLYGFAFVKADISNWIPNMLHALLTNPGVYIPELVGAVILTWFAWTLLRRRKIFAFIRYGQVR